MIDGDKHRDLALTYDGRGQVGAPHRVYRRRDDGAVVVARASGCPQGDRLRGSGIPARALLCFMSRLATSEVGHGEQSDKAAPDRTLLGPQFDFARFVTL